MDIMVGTPYGMQRALGVVELLAALGRRGLLGAPRLIRLVVFRLQDQRAGRGRPELRIRSGPSSIYAPDAGEIRWIGGRLRMDHR